MWRLFVAVPTEKRAMQRYFRLLDGCDRNLFSHVIVTPVMASKQFLEYLRNLREAGQVERVMFDSGGYQVQTGVIESFEKLCVRLVNVWRRHDWADYFVLPDHVPKSRDTEMEVEKKVRDTLLAGERFLKLLPKGGEPVGVVHGRSVVQVLKGVRSWHSLGVRYVAFGSFETIGKNESINHVSDRAAVVLRALVDEALSLGMKVHVFGIGSPSSLQKVFIASPLVESVDSVSWRKVAGFHEVFFGLRWLRRFGDLRSKSNSWRLDDELLSKVKRFMGHDCPFCRSAVQLTDFTARSLHNLFVLHEIVDGFRHMAERMRE